MSERMNQDQHPEMSWARVVRALRSHLRIRAEDVGSSALGTENPALRTFLAEYKEKMRGAYAQSRNDH